LCPVNSGPGRDELRLARPHNRRQDKAGSGCLMTGIDVQPDGGAYECLTWLGVSQVARAADENCEGRRPPGFASGDVWHNRLGVVYDPLLQRPRTGTAMLLLM